MKGDDMQRIIFILIVGCILTGCNFPLFQNSDDSDVIANQVAYFLTQTAEVLPKNNETPAYKQATPSQEPSPTITPTPSDPASALGSPFWSGGLNSGGAFGLSDPYEDPNSRIYIQNGKMILISLQAVGWKTWRLTDRQISNYYLEAQFKTQSCAGMDKYGLVFRANDYGSGMGYYYEVTCGGLFGLLKWGTSNQSYVINQTANTNIMQGSNQTNRLGVLVKGNSIRLFANGKQIFETNDSSFQTATKIGVFIAAVNTPGLTVEVSQIQMWNVP
jgi:hypothetical protein